MSFRRLKNVLFNSYVFILGFLPVVFLTYYLLLKLNNKYVAKSFLVLASLYFYSYWNIKYLPLILASIIVNFFLSWLINKNLEKKSKKLYLVVGIIFNVILLGYYKYYDFFITNVNYLFSTNIPLLQLALPLAISFFTFQQIAYLVDTFRGETQGYKFLDYALFVTFFPQLIAGPIVHHSEIISQLREEKNYKLNIKNISAGIYIFSLGLFKKVIIADTFAQWANQGYENISSLTVFDSWITTLSYTFQLYFDFSGYCDMAMGLALLFNIKLPINFNSPYKSLNIQEFWRRWHITLGRFFTQYVYIPLGGNRKGPIRTYFNVFFIFFLSGIWHGAGWTFVIWGVLHGLASILYRFWKGFNIQLPKWFSWFLTFGFVHVAWVYFRSPSVDIANQMLYKMFNIGDFHFPPKINSLLNELLGTHFVPRNYYFDLKLSLLMLVTLVIVIITKNSVEKLNTFKPNYKNAVIVSLLAVLSLLYLNRVSEFLYFNF
jgi:alginate O-acetyltransferase complex protein AlgI